jgi:hypothetical protein
VRKQFRYLNKSKINLTKNPGEERALSLEPNGYFQCQLDFHV